jgi:16S rRNA processing protein RimM
MTNYFEIGKIVNTQGLKGDVRVVPMTDDITRFELLNELTVRFSGNVVRSFGIERVWYHKSFVVLKLGGVDDMTSAERLKGGMVVVPPELALPLNDGEYYIRDILGMEVATIDGESLGVVANIIETGANDIYVVRDAESGKEILIPAIKQCLRDIDVTNKKMTVELLEGLR